MDGTLEGAQRELESYGRTAEDDDLIKSLLGIGDQLTTLAKSDGAADDESDDTAAAADDTDDADGDADADEESDGDDDGDDDASDAGDAAPPAKMGKSRSADGSAGEQFIKSMVEDEAQRDMIEVSDVLTYMTDTFAKSLDAHDVEIGKVQLQGDRAYGLLTAVAKGLILLDTKVTKAMQQQADLAKSQQAQTAQPFNGLQFSRGRQLPMAAAEPQREALTKGQVNDSLLAAFNEGHLTQQQFSRATLTVDSQGVDEALNQVPKPVADSIRTGAFL